MTERKQFICDSQVLVAVLEKVVGGWKLVVRGKQIGIFRTREQAIKAIDVEIPERLSLCDGKGHRPSGSSDGRERRSNDEENANWSLRL